jgi:hypothetical protein
MMLISGEPEISALHPPLGGTEKGETAWPAPQETGPAERWLFENESFRHSGAR